jgi:nucleotide-binding universal stress UspA family protein
VIAVATDLSEASRRVFPAAALLARHFGARVVGVHVPEGGAPADPEDVRAFLGRDFEEASVRIEKQPVWRGLVHAATEEKADLIAIARQGADSLGEDILGTTTDRVLRHAPCPVLVA